MHDLLCSHAKNFFFYTKQEKSKKLEKRAKPFAKMTLNDSRGGGVSKPVFLNDRNDLGKLGEGGV